MTRSLVDELEGALVNSEGKDFQIRASFVRELIAALRIAPEARSVPCMNGRQYHVVYPEASRCRDCGLELPQPQKLSSE